jgi:hypothetical protein
MPYTVRKTAAAPALDGQWNSSVWQQAETITVGVARPESTDHHPTVQVRLLHDGTNIFGMFRVEDRYVRSVRTRFQDPVCNDSCVEFFFRPHTGTAYFNFEFNAGGTFLCAYIRDWTRIGKAGFADYTMLGPEAERMVKVHHSLPATVEPEIAGPTVWTLQFALPVSLLENYAGDIGKLDGRSWTANFYKCGDETSHPHWLSWAPVSALNFHLPDCFQPIQFAAD